MSKKASKKGVNVAIIVAIIGLAGTIITALLNSPHLFKPPIKIPMDTPSPPPPVNGASLVFSQNFEDGTASGFGFTDDNWSVKRDRSNYVLIGDASPLETDESTEAIFGPTDFRDGIIEFKLKFEKLGSFDLCFRSRDSALYVLFLNGDDGAASLVYNSEAEGWQFTPFSKETTQVFSFEPDVWYVVHLEARGPQVTVSINKNWLFTGNDSRLQSGRIRYSIVDNAKVMLDDVKIWSFAE